MSIGDITAKQVEKALYKKLGCNANLKMKVKIKKIGLFEKKSRVYVDVEGTLAKEELLKILQNVDLY